METVNYMWLVILSGLPASGKTTFREKLINRLLIDMNKMPIIKSVSSDDWLESIANARGLTYTEAWKKYAPMCESAFWNDIDLTIAIDNPDVLIADRTHLTQASRLRTLERVAKQVEKFKTIAVHFNTPQAGDLDARLRKRESEGKILPVSTMLDMASRMSNPSEDNAGVAIPYYDHVVTVKDTHDPEYLTKVVEIICNG